MFNRTISQIAALFLALPWLAYAQASQPSGGELKQWHRVTLTFAGPETSETASPNPFLDFRFNVTFTHASSKATFTVPGFFAADGKAAETSAAGGNQWRVHFTPNQTGEWHWRVSFRTGKDIAVETNLNAGAAWSPLDGKTGSFVIAASDKSAPDFRARGMLDYAGKRYLRFAGDGSYFLKAGVGSPETLLGYADFDGTARDLSTNNFPVAPNSIIKLPALRDGLHHYEAHLEDWRDGDPTWQGGKGKGLIGGLNYLASQHVNALYFLTMNVNGDGRNVWPWVEAWQRDRFDVSKLDQWEIVFSHMTQLGVMPHFVTQETENDHLLDKGDLGIERKLYYRELIARFAHHPALTWNLGEENVQTARQQKDCAAFINQLDPYKHHIVIHNDHWHAKNLRETFDPLLGFKPLTGTALQDFYWNSVHTHVRHYVAASERAGHPWVVAADELGGANYGTFPDADDATHDAPRRFGLWGTLMAGGAGVEWYFGWQNNSPHSDLSAENWRTRETMYQQTKIALDFFRQIPFHEMQSADEIAVGHGVYAFKTTVQSREKIIALYLPNGNGTRFDLGAEPGLYEIKWFNPRQGGGLLDGSIKRVRGPGFSWTGEPPSEPLQDWAVIVRRIAESAPLTMQFPAREWQRAAPEDLGVNASGLNHALNQWRMATGKDGVDETVIVRRGIVIWSGQQADRAHNIYSATKSFTSTALGLLIADGKLKLNTPAAALDPALKTFYPRATLRHFTTMTSGYNAPGDSRWQEKSADWSATPYTPAAPLFLPGSQFAYWDEAQMMFGRLLTKAAQRDLLELMTERVFAPIGMRVESWGTEGEINGIKIRNGCTGLKVNAWELARFGHLFLNQGNWNGQQLIAKDWIAQATRPQVSAKKPVAKTDRAGIDGRGIYGFNWWTNGIDATGARALPDAPAGAYWAEGLHHNILLVIPEWEMVVVRMGEDRSPLGGHEAALNRFVRRLAQSVSPLAR
jgi:CubicO group peptidase (beta-lactamase class C family)